MSGVSLSGLTTGSLTSLGYIRGNGTELLDLHAGGFEELIYVYAIVPFQ